MTSFHGLATGIGSLPFKDPDPALDLIFTYCFEIPFWPQLPQRGACESMVAQFSENLPCLRFTEEGVIFDPRNQDSEMEKFYERIIGQDVGHFRISEGFAPGLWRFAERLEKSDLDEVEFIKFHVTGPFTFAASINNEKNLPLLHDEIFMQAIVKGLIMKALWQANFFRKFGKKMIVFLDEPYLSCFGSAFTPITKEMVLGVLDEFAAALSAEDLLMGIHCCGNTDWSLFTGTKGLDIINFDAFSFLDRVVLYGDDLKAFLERGGVLCWGIVPTQIPGGLTRDNLLKTIDGGIRTLISKGIDEQMLRDRLLVSPACGLGNQTPEEAEKVFGLLREVSGKLRV